jgi:hypothetical protein
MRKRGQISVFIIVAIVIVVTLILYFAVKGDLIFVSGINPEIEHIYSFVDNCVNQVSEDAIYQIGYSGGYFLTPEVASETGIAIYFDRGENLIPLKEDIENELSLYVNDMLFFCVQNFVDFPDFIVDAGEIKSEVEIVEGKVIFYVNYPLSINKGDNTYSLKSFKTEIPSRLNTIYNVALEIILEQMLYYGGVCVNCVSEIAYENQVYVFMNDDFFDSDILLFSIVDDLYKINEEDYTFYFANRYDEESELLEE